MEVSPLLTPLCCFSPQPYSHVPTYVPGAWHRVSTGGTGGQRGACPVHGKGGGALQGGHAAGPWGLKGGAGALPSPKWGGVCVSPSLCPPRGFPPALSALALLPGRRHTPYGNQTDYRIFELNKRLQNWTEVGSSRGGWPGAGGCSQLGVLGTGSLRQDGDSPFPAARHGAVGDPASLWHPQECDNLWWDAFTTEFFEDDAMLTITFCLEDGPKRYSE